MPDYFDPMFQSEVPQPEEKEAPQSGVPTKDKETEILDLYEAGILTPEQATDAIADHRVVNRSLFDLDPEDVESLYARDKLDGPSVDAYLEHSENPGLYWTKEALRTPVKGVERAVEDMAGFTAEVWNWINPFNAFDVNPNAEIPDVIRETTHWSSDVGAELVSYLVPFTTATKAVRATQAVQKIMSTDKMLQIAASSPKAAALIEYTLEGTLAGAAADIVSFDINDGRLTDLAKEHGYLPELLDFMTTDPTNPMPLERLKAAMEGAVLGVGIDTLIKSYKGIRAAMMRQMGNDLDKVAEKIVTNPDLAPEFNKVVEGRVNRAVPKDLAEKQYYNRMGLEQQRDKLANKVGKSPRDKQVLEYLNKQIENLKKTEAAPDLDGAAKKADPADLPEGEAAGRASSDVADDLMTKKRAEFGDIAKGGTKGFKIVSDIIHGVEPKGEATDEILRVMEETADPNKVMDRIFDEFKPAIDRDRGGPLKQRKGNAGGNVGRPYRQSWTSTEREASKIIKEVDADNPEQAIAFFKQRLGPMADVVQTARAFERYFRKYASDVDKLIAEVKKRPTIEAKIRAAHHISYLGQMTSMVHGVRSSSGRLLNSFQMSLGVKGFDYANIPDLTFQALKENEGALDELIDVFKKSKKLSDKTKVAKRFGKQPWQRRILQWSQAAKLWNPRTHITNVVSQTGMLTAHTLNRMLAVGFNSVTKADLGLMKEIYYLWEGYTMALENLFKNPGTIKKVVAGRLSGKYTSVRQAVLDNPELGAFYKAFITGEGQIDKATKLVDKETLEHMGDIGEGAFTRAWQAPFTGLATVDEGFKNLGYFSEINSLAFREGYSQGLRGKELNDHIAKALNGDNAALHEQAILKSRELTFQLPLDKASEGLREILDKKLPGGLGLLLRAAVLPYYNVPINIAKTALKYTPFGVLNTNYLKAIKSGDRVKAFEMTLAIAEGSTLMWWAYNRYKSGKLTGMIPPSQYAAHKNKGVQEYSTYDDETGQWASLERYAPGSMIVGLTADICKVAEMVEQCHDPRLDITSEDVILAGIQGLGAMFVEGTWARSAKDVMGMMTMYSNDRAKKFGLNVAKGMIPGQNVWQDTAKWRTEDKIARQIDSMLDVVQSMIDPTLLRPERHAVYGTIMETTPRVAGPETLGAYPMHRTKQELDDPVLQEMLNLGINVKTMAEEQTFLGEKEDITPEKIEQFYDELAQFPVQEILSKVLENPGYQGIGDYETKKAIFGGIYGEIRKAAKERWLATDKELLDKYVTKVRTRADAIMGFHLADNPTSALYHYMNKR